MWLWRFLPPTEVKREREERKRGGKKKKLYLDITAGEGTWSVSSGLGLS